MAKNTEYIAILRSGPLQIEFEEYDQFKEIAEYINCDWIDHTSVFDDLTACDIDLWIDDEGLLNNKDAVFVFMNDQNDIVGQIVGDVAFLKHDRSGDSYGLTWDECQSLKRWLSDHDFALFNNPNSDRDFYAYIVRQFETEQHRKSIEETKKWFEDNGGFVIHM